MSSAIKRAYSDLFQLYENACERDDESLRNFFTPTTDAGEQVVNLTVATFKTLCSFAEFKAHVEEREGGKEEEKKEKKADEVAHAPAGVAVNLNIQLTLPITENEKVYENIFKALRDNLLSRESKTD